MNLSDHITLEAMTCSDTAARKGIENTADTAQILNMKTLAADALEPAWAILGGFHINSGFRVPALNVALGGATNSAHMDGRAADLHITGMTLQAAFDALRTSAIPYDQIITECGAWIHLAIARPGETPRRMALSATGGPGAWHYTEVANG